MDPFYILDGLAVFVGLVVIMAVFSKDNYQK